MDWERIIDKFGLPLAGLVVVGLFFYRTLWPFIKERIAAAEKVLTEQVAEAREARKEDQREFLAALEKRDDALREHTEALRQLTKEIEGRRGARRP